MISTPVPLIKTNQRIVKVLVFQVKNFELRTNCLDPSAGGRQRPPYAQEKGLIFANQHKQHFFGISGSRTR